MVREVNAVHLLRRTEFVARPERVAALRAMSRREAVDDVLDVSRNPPAVLPPAVDGATGRRDAVHWWIDRMATVPRPVQEKMTLFWHGHLVSSWLKVEPTGPMLDQNELFRTAGLGGFRDLVHAVSVDPAMLRYLDNRTNSKESPNQNFARELMELFTLGAVDPDADGVRNYTEADVRASAAAWTGYTLDDTGAFVFDPARHDTTERTFLGLTRVWDGPGVIDALLRDVPRTRDVAARWLARRVWEFFAAPVPVGPNPVVVHDLARVLLDTDFDVASLVRAVLLRDEFYADDVRSGLVRTPVEYAVHLAVASRYPVGDWLDVTAMAETGQVPFFPPNVAGWHANGYWVSSTGFLARAAMAVAAATRMVRRPDGTSTRLGVALADASPRLALRRAIRAVWFDEDAPLTDVTRTALERFVDAGPTGERRAIQLLTLLFLAPEFHL